MSTLLISTQRVLLALLTQIDCWSGQCGCYCWRYPVDGRRQVLLQNMPGLKNAWGVLQVQN